MSAQDAAGAYEPRQGDYVTVRRYIQPTTGERTLHSEHLGQITGVCPQSGGYRIWLNTLPDDEWIYTGYQFLGAGTDGSGPASLVTEIAPMKADGLRIQVSPDLALLLDASQCIVAEVTDPAAGGEVLRRVTITNVDKVKATLDTLRAAQQDRLRDADQARVASIYAHRCTEGKLDRQDAVEWLIARGMSRMKAGNITAALREGGQADEALGMSYEDGYWRVPV